MIELLGYTVSYGGSLEDTFGAAIVSRALELAKGQSAYANIMPYIYRALDEARNQCPRSEQAPDPDGI